MQHRCRVKNPNSFHVEASVKYFPLNQSATLTSAIRAGTSTNNGPVTAAKASPELISDNSYDSPGTATLHKACHASFQLHLCKQRDG